MCSNWGCVTSGTVAVQSMFQFKLKNTTWHLNTIVCQLWEDELYWAEMTRHLELGITDEQLAQIKCENLYHFGEILEYFE